MAKELNPGMRRILGLLMVILVFAGPVWAQPFPGGGKPGIGPMGGSGGMGPQIYGRQTAVTTQGIVERVENFQTLGPSGLPEGGMSLGVVLKTDQGSLTIHLAPPWYLSQNNFSVRVGDILEVRGSRSPISMAAIIARVVTKDGRTLRLRDEQGLPLWR
jgi:hypothetical protein